MKWVWLELVAVSALVIAIAFFTPRESGPGTALDQGWSRQDVERWYGAYQGSRLMPLAWFEALEQPDGQGRFLDSGYIARFGYIPRPGELPIGFAVDVQDASALQNTNLVWKRGQSPSAPWVGMTCAACHTGEIRHRGRRIRIEGGATLADFQAFLEAVNRALQQTRDDPQKFERFARRVLAPFPRSGDVTRLREALGRLVDYQQKLAALSKTDMRYGYGRLDAVGYIYNKAAFIAHPEAPTANAPDAPVSYPFLWNTSQQTHIQWDGIAENTPVRLAGGQTLDLGALGRNFGEVTGVFGDVSATAGPKGPQYASSIEVNNLVALEQQLMRLKPPRWPRELFPIDERLAREGRTIYDAHCVACHVELKRDDLTTRTRPGPGGAALSLEVMSYLYPRAGDPAIDTDPWMACNAAIEELASGVLKGAPTGVKTQATLGDPAPGSMTLRAIIVGVMHADWRDVALAGIESFTATHPPPRMLRARIRGERGVAAFAVPGARSARADRTERCAQYGASENYRDIAYKARPLTGVWATGPFLHNGSVPTLYDLLLPPDKRPTVFRVGSREFDPNHVGFVTGPAPGNDFVFHVRDAGGAIIDGNSNQGHDYGASGFTEHQRLALLEYLKVIGE